MANDDPESSTAEDRALEHWRAKGEASWCSLNVDAFRAGFRAGQEHPKALHVQIREHDRLSKLEHTVARWEHGDGAKAICELRDRVSGIQEAWRGTLAAPENLVDVERRLKALEPRSQDAMRWIEEAERRIDALESWRKDVESQEPID